MKENGRDKNDIFKFTWLKMKLFRRVRAIAIVLGVVVMNFVKEIHDPQIYVQLLCAIPFALAIICWILLSFIPCPRCQEYPFGMRFGGLISNLFDGCHSCGLIYQEMPTRYNTSDEIKALRRAGKRKALLFSIVLMIIIASYFLDKIGFL